MKKSPMKLTVLVAAVAFLLPVSLLAQEEKEKVKEEKKEKKESEQIIITRKVETDVKIVVEINGDNVTINGKPIAEYKDANISVRRGKIKDAQSYYYTQPDSKTVTWDGKHYDVFTEDANHAMLGVTTEKNEGGGVKINDVTKESAAEKIGLKEGDIITKVDNTKIEDPDGLSKVIREHKPGDKISVTYLRDKKEQTATAELTKWKGSIKMDMSEMNLGRSMPRVQTAPRTPYAQNWTWSGGSPKLGLSVQDTDDGKGVKVIEVDSESNAAKAGVKENDVINEVDGKAVNSTDEMVKLIKESKEKNSIMLKLQRGGKTQNIEVKMPKKIKTADL